MEDINPKIETEVEEQDSLTENQKRILCKSLEQADSGLGTSLKIINRRLREKYGLDS